MSWRLGVCGGVAGPKMQLQRRCSAVRPVVGYSYPYPSYLGIIYSLEIGREGHEEIHYLLSLKQLRGIMFILALDVNPPYILTYKCLQSSGLI